MKYKLTYSSLFSYCPQCSTKESLTAREFMKCLKNNWPFGGKDPSEIVVQTLLKNVSQWSSIFHGDVVLVPVPRSAPMRKGSLWPPFLLAEEMQKVGLGRVSTLLERVEKVNPSSLSRAKDRPGPIKHFESIRLRRSKVSDVKNVILVDDLVTRGHTFMGCAWRIEEAYPEASIHAFAAIRTVSNPDEFRGLFDPVELGTIIYREDRDDCLRRP